MFLSLSDSKLGNQSLDARKLQGPHFCMRGRGHLEFKVTLKCPGHMPGGYTVQMLTAGMCIESRPALGV